MQPIFLKLELLDFVLIELLLVGTNLRGKFPIKKLYIFHNLILLRKNWYHLIDVPFIMLSIIGSLQYNKLRWNRLKKICQMRKLSLKATFITFNLLCQFTSFMTCSRAPSSYLVFPNKDKSFDVLLSLIKLPKFLTNSCKKFLSIFHIMYEYPQWKSCLR